MYAIVWMNIWMDVFLVSSFAHRRAHVIHSFVLSKKLKTKPVRNFLLFKKQIPLGYNIIFYFFFLNRYLKENMGFEMVCEYCFTKVVLHFQSYLY